MPKAEPSGDEARVRFGAVPYYGAKVPGRITGTLVCVVEDGEWKLGYLEGQGERKEEEQ